VTADDLAYDIAERLIIFREDYLSQQSLIFLGEGIISGQKFNGKIRLIFYYEREITAVSYRLFQSQHKKSPLFLKTTLVSDTRVRSLILRTV